MTQSKLNLKRMIEQRKEHKAASSSQREITAQSFYGSQNTLDTFYKQESALALRHKLCTKHMGGVDPYLALADKFYPKPMKTSTSSFYNWML